jgi:hypothetical protein
MGARGHILDTFPVLLGRFSGAILRSCRLLLELTSLQGAPDMYRFEIMRTGSFAPEQDTYNLECEKLTCRAPCKQNSIRRELAKTVPNNILRSAGGLRIPMNSSLQPRHT